MWQVITHPHVPPYISVLFVHTKIELSINARNKEVEMTDSEKYKTYTSFKLYNIVCKLYNIIF